MPRAGRGPALETKNVTRWTDDECGTLAIFEVEMRGANGLSDEDYYALWHAVFPDHIKEGRDYNVVKLHETFALRHYKKKSSRMVRICRPNKAFDGARPDAHTDDEKKWFESLRRVIRAKAQTLQITLPTSAAKVDSGAMCTCPECSGLVKHREPTLDDDGKVKKTKPRGSNAGRKRKRTADVDDEDTAANRAVIASAWRQQKATVEQSFMRPGSSFARASVSREGTSSIHYSATTQNSHFSSTSISSNPNFNFDQSFAAPASFFATATGFLQTGQSQGDSDVEMPDEGTQTNKGSDDENEGEDHGEGSDSHPVKLSKVRKTHSILPMYHFSDIVFRQNMLVLQEHAQPVDDFNPVRQHGGPIAMLHEWTEENVTQHGYPFMLCDSAKCVTCSGAFANASMVSPTRGMGFVHATQCFLDEESKTLLFAPDQSNQYAPCQENQEFAVREVVLTHHRRPEKHLLAVCKVSSCEVCQDRILAGLGH